MENEKKKEELIDVHLKRKIYLWNGEKMCTVRKISGTLKALHLEVIDGQGYVVAPFIFPDNYGCYSYSKDGFIFPIKESVEFVAAIKIRQALLSKEKK